MKYKDLDGTIVIFPPEDGTKYIVHRGWYKYQGSMQNGWYGISIEDGSVHPFTYEELSKLVPIDDKYPPYFPPGPCPPGPCPPGPWPPGPPPRPWPPGGDGVHMSGAFSVADTFDDLQSIPKYSRFDGMIVRVNEGEDGPVNYTWNAENKAWEVVKLDGDCKIPWEEF